MNRYLIYFLICMIWMIGGTVMSIVYLIEGSDSLVWEVFTLYGVIFSMVILYSKNNDWVEK